MILREWEKLPVFLRLEEVRPYYDILYERRGQLAVKRIFDFFMAAILTPIITF